MGQAGLGPMDRIPRRDVADTAEPRHEAYGAHYAPVLWTLARGGRFGHPLGLPTGELRSWHVKRRLRPPDQARHWCPREWWEPSPRPLGAGAGPLAACPQGSVQPLGPVAPLAPPSLGGMALACLSVGPLSP